MVAHQRFVRAFADRRNVPLVLNPPAASVTAAAVLTVLRARRSARPLFSDKPDRNLIAWQ
jgi:hypothetical protein